MSLIQQFFKLIHNMEDIMLKKIMICVLGIFITFSFTGEIMAGDKGNWRKGKRSYRNVYKACFKRGAVEKAKPPISPDTKTQGQWKRVFDNKKFSAFGCKEEWEKLSEKDLLNIFTYLHDHAADSPTPAKCK